MDGLCLVMLERNADTAAVRDLFEPDLIGIHTAEAANPTLL